MLCDIKFCYIFLLIYLFTSQVGIICGSGLGNSVEETFDYSSTSNREDIKNSFGYPTSNLYHGHINGVDVVLLSR